MEELSQVTSQILIGTGRTPDTETRVEERARRSLCFDIIFILKTNNIGQSSIYKDTLTSSYKD